VVAAHTNLQADGVCIRKAMESKHRLILWLALLAAALFLGMDCNNTTLRAQQEKTKQLQIIQSMQLYQLERESVSPFRPHFL
jgi:hypothetical protein